MAANPPLVVLIVKMLINTNKLVIILYFLHIKKTHACLGEYHVPWVDQSLYSPHRKSSIVYCSQV